ncbi:MAG: class E sortase [Rubrobacteraceae bacterium]
MKNKRTRGLISGILSLVMVLSGVALVGVFFFGNNLDNSATNDPNPGGFNVPELGSDQAATAGGPEDKTLKLTVPKMNRIKDDTVPYAAGNDNEALGANAGIHLQGTGFPWDAEANVYVAGHRLGYPNTDSFLAFWDLNKLENGDEIFVTDADGARYTYEVFKETVVSPTDLSVTEPIPGKNIITLQTCTLPDYSNRLIVQAEQVAVT